jgi:endonuclease/exonuclease/phosphatase family metal-dependent hydrolase
MLLFTWNVHRSEPALRLALTHLARVARSDTVVACFQEVPPEARDHDAWRAGWETLREELPRTGLRFVDETVAAGRVVMLCSADLQVASAIVDGSERMLFVTFRLATGSELAVVGYHAVDRINYVLAEARGGYQALARRELDENVPAEMPAVVLGDFNASPGTPELADRACFYVLDPSQRHRPSADTHFGRASRPLFAAVPDTPEGSIFVQWGGRNRWEKYDFVAVTSQLQERVKARIRQEIGGVNLLRPRAGTPNAAAYSDHLPVEAELEFR